MTADKGDQVSEVDRLRETVQDLLDNGWHYYECPCTRRSQVKCNCGWKRARERAERVMIETLNGGPTP